MLRRLQVVLAGAQLFSLAYASITVLTAVLKRVLLGKGQSIEQWLSLVIITSGARPRPPRPPAPLAARAEPGLWSDPPLILLLAAAGLMVSAHAAHELGGTVFIGVACGFGSACAYAHMRPPLPAPGLSDAVESSRRPCLPAGWVRGLSGRRGSWHGAGACSRCCT